VIYRDIEHEVFGDDQRIQKSKYSEGFFVVFHVDGLECALTADSQDAFVDAILCRPAPRAKRSIDTKMGSVLI
jgi:hypothetical protein